MHKPTTTRAITMTLLAAGAMALVLAGCHKQLFPKDEPRSQYDRFDSVRDSRAPDRVEDAFGNQRANLRGRLLTGE